MSQQKIFDVEDINHLLEQNSQPPFGARNAALIMSGVCWGLSPLEQSLVAIEDVMASNGEFYKIWTLPAAHSFNGEAREIYTEDHVVPFFELYADYLTDQALIQSNLAAYRSFDPSSKLFVNDKGTRYALTARKTDSSTSKVSYQPRSITEQLKRMLARTNLHGSTPASLRDSYIKGLYDNGAGWEDLKRITGIKHKKSLEKKVRPHERELKSVLASMFSKVKNPNDLIK
jgi:integrase